MSTTPTSPDDGFRSYFGNEPESRAAAPGRVNIIGEHIDYNLGHVLPFAIGQRITVAAGRQPEPRIDAYSALIDAAASFPSDVSVPDPKPGWHNYLRGVVHGLRTRGIDVPGVRLWYGGDLLPGSGMSSSAALCVCTAYALLNLVDAQLPGTEIVRIGQEAEHNFAGMPCGVMDQYASTFGRDGYALLLDCHALRHEEIQLQLPNTEWLMIPSGVEHALVEGAYEQRVAQCQEALRVIRQHHPKIEALAQVNRTQLAACQDELPPLIARRARHVVTETERVREMVSTLPTGNVHRVGELLWETQDSLRDDYEVSCPEVDEQITLLRSTPGVLGARMVGGGFGGVLLALIEAGQSERIAERVRLANYAQRGITEEILVIAPADGAMRLSR